MDTFQEKLEEIAGREFDIRATKPLERFQNRIMIEKNEISKLMHRCKKKMQNIAYADLTENIDGRLMNEQQGKLKEDMRQYIRMHYELKEEMMDYFAKWL